MTDPRSRDAHGAAVAEAAAELETLIDTSRILARGPEEAGWVSEDDAWDELGAPGVSAWRYAQMAVQLIALAEGYLLLLREHAAAPTSRRPSWGAWCVLHGEMMCPITAQILSVADLLAPSRAEGI